MKVPMIALRDFYYAGNTAIKGKPVDIEEKDMEILLLAGAVERSVDEKPKRRYQRRDMTAENS